MLTVLFLVGLLAASAVAMPPKQSRNVSPFFLDYGEVCWAGDVCPTYCCVWDTLWGYCAPPSPENERCEFDHLVDFYDYCPCETGLSCNSINGVRICVDEHDIESFAE